MLSLGVIDIYPASLPSLDDTTRSSRIYYYSITTLLCFTDVSGPHILSPQSTRTNVVEIQLRMQAIDSRSRPDVVQTLK